MVFKGLGGPRRLRLMRENRDGFQNLLAGIRRRISDSLRVSVVACWVISFSLSSLILVPSREEPNIQMSSNDAEREVYK